MCIVQCAKQKRHGRDIHVEAQQIPVSANLYVKRVVEPANQELASKQH